MIISYIVMMIAISKNIMSPLKAFMLGISLSAIEICFYIYFLQGIGVIR